MPIGTAAAIGLGLAGAGSVAGAAIGAGAAGDAADKQLAANEKSIQAQKEMADKAAALYREQAGIARQDLQPFRDAQVQSLAQLQALTDPSSGLYQKQREVNTQAIQRQLAAQGLLRSKGQADLLSNLELGLNEQRVGILGGIAGNGAAQNMAQLSQGLGSQLGGIYGNLGGQIGSSFQQAGQIAGQAGLQRAGFINSAIQGVGSAINGTIAQAESLKQLKLILGKA